MIFNCPKCNGQFQAEGTGIVRCPTCQTEVRLPDSALNGCAWDRAKKGEWVHAFTECIKEAITRPVNFFQQVSGGYGWQRPLLFAVIVCEISFLIGSVFQLGFKLMTDVAIGGPFAAFMVPLTWFFTILSLIIMPVMIGLAVLIGAGINHLCLMLFGAAKRDFIHTFRVASYVMVSQVCTILPLFGPMAAVVWGVVLNIIGLKVVHDTTYGRSALAVLLPTILCCGIILIIIMAIAGGIFAGIVSGAR